MPPEPPTPHTPTVPFVMNWASVKRILKIVAGFLLLPIGVVMLPLPGPGWLVIFLALAILAGEFVWARTLMDRLKQFGARLDPRKPRP
jgi:uncharacterized protein (TIGR02611 family)